MHLTCRHFQLATDLKTATRQLRRVLKQIHLRIPIGCFSILDRRDDKLRCAFVLEEGFPGVLK